MKTANGAGRGDAGDTVRARAVVSGRVQGVGFRQSAALEAQRIGGLSGWVKNLPTGEVEALVEGERDRVEAFLAWCRRGPRLARVDEVRVGYEPARGDLGPFDVAF